MFERLSAYTAMTIAAAACGGADSTADTEATGEARFADAETRPDGTANEPARPQSGFTVSVEVAGSGSLSGLDASCLDGATGQFEGLLGGTAEIDDGVYVAGVASGQGSFSTPSGCAIPDLEITALTRVVVRAELVASVQTCESYCSAKARQSAEGECSGSGDQASCRAAAEGDYSASCEVACEGSEHRIVAETEMSTAARAELLASQVAGSSLGTIAADLTFDHIEDGAGDPVAENP